MSVWFTSDLHIGHVKVAADRMRGRVLPRYVGADVEAHDRILAENWDRAVGTKDQVWVLGDISGGGSAAQAYALQWLFERPGHKHLIAGNHDRVHSSYRDAHKWQPLYLESFDSVQSFGRRRIAGRSVLLSHFPYQGDHTDEDRCEQYRLRDHGELLLHGHTHSRERISHAGRPGVAAPRQIHVGVDAWDLKPVHLDELAALIGASS